MPLEAVASDRCAECAACAGASRSPRFIVIGRHDGAISGDTGTDWFREFRGTSRRLTPGAAVRLVESTICDHPGYRYREVAREDAAATFDVYRAAPDYPQDSEAAAIERDCEYVATLARIYPRCCFCRRLTEYHPWQYGHDPRPVREKGRCCDRCYIRRILPARLRAEGYYSEEEIAAECERERACLARDR